MATTTTDKASKKEGKRKRNTNCSVKRARRDKLERGGKLQCNPTEEEQELSRRQLLQQPSSSAPQEESSHLQFLQQPSSSASLTKTSSSSVQCFLTTTTSAVDGVTSQDRSASESNLALAPAKGSEAASRCSSTTGVERAARSGGGGGGGGGSEDHLAAILMGIVLVFLACHSPRVLLNLYEVATIASRGEDHCGRFSPWTLMAISVSHFLLVVNSATNAAVYCALSTSFRQEFARIFGRSGAASSSNNGPRQSAI